ncbi:MAG: shikimate dehydrogenase, partial [Desulfobacteraceae bacterium]|nr:shikimate dehydrogenase [Desulfobacteraceae bacterium]
SIRELNIQGVSVTIPVKESVMEHLDVIHDESKAIGAVNTIVNENGRLKGFNTDHNAAVDPIKDFGILNKKVVILGAGGAALAVAYGIKNRGGILTIVNRSTEKGKALSKKMGCNFIPLDDLKLLDADIVINTTAVGMTPHSDETPIDPGLLKEKMIVMDVVYTPVKTRLLKEAKKIGCHTIDGVSMFVCQGAAQFELWTGIRPDLQIMRDAMKMGDQ